MTSAAAANAYRIRRFFYIGRSAQGGHGWPNPAHEDREPTKIEGLSNPVCEATR